MEWIYQKSQKKNTRRAVYQGISEKLYETKKKCQGKPLACDCRNINILIAFEYVCGWQGVGGVSLEKGMERGNDGTSVLIKGL